MGMIVSLICVSFICHISLLLSGKDRKSQIPLTWLTLQITYYNKPSMNPVFEQNNPLTPICLGCNNNYWLARP